MTTNNASSLTCARSVHCYVFFCAKGGRGKKIQWESKWYGEEELRRREENIILQSADLTEKRMLFLKFAVLGKVGHSLYGSSPIQCNNTRLSSRERPDTITNMYIDRWFSNKKGKVSFDALVDQQECEMLQPKFEKWGKDSLVTQIIYNKSILYIMYKHICSFAIKRHSYNSYSTFLQNSTETEHLFRN